MKSLKESLLDNEEDLIDNSSIESELNKNFPQKNNIITILKDPQRTKYYVWECPIVFSLLDQKVSKSFYNNDRYKNKRSFVVSWHKSEYDEDNYIVELYMSPSRKADVYGHCTQIAMSEPNAGYTAVKAKTLAYKVLQELKTNYEKLLKYEFGFRVEELFKK